MEEKIIEIKRKLGEKKVGIIYFAILCIITLFFMNILKEYKVEKQQVEDSYNKSLYNFIGDINNIENEMLKLKITTNDTYTLTTLASIYAKANSSISNLAALPFSPNITESITKFLTQTSDYSYTLMRNIINNNSAEVEKAKDNIEKLYERIEELDKTLNTLYVEINEKSIKWNELKEEGDKILNKNIENTESTLTAKVVKPFTDYEGIIYDGAFSNHILSLEPKSLTDRIISQEEVESLLKGKFETMEVQFIQNIDGQIELYEFKVGNKEIYITKRDGKLYQLLSDRKVEEKKIESKEAIEKAKEFLRKWNIENIEETYYQELDNTLTISFATIQDNVICYTDLIKVKVALDNGEILMVEANGYIFNNTYRVFNPVITEDEAKQKLNENITIKNLRLAIIPTESKDEVLSYEFMGTVEDKKFLVYINAQNGITEKIYILLQTQGGTLAI